MRKAEGRRQKAEGSKRRISARTILLTERRSSQLVRCLLPAAFRFLPSAFFILLSAFCLLPSSTSAADAGWTKQPAGTLAWLRAVYFLDRDRGWAVGGSGALLGTIDGGKNWRILRRPTEDTLHDIYFSDAEHGWLVCERSIYLLKAKDEPRSYLLRTSDGGASWKRVEVTGTDIDLAVIRITFANDERGWVFGEMGALYATEDGGRTWARQPVPTKHLLHGAAFLDDGQGWLVGAGLTILKTTDGGATWREGQIEQVTDKPPASAQLRAVSFVDERRGWAVGTGGVVFATTNGGRTWRALATPTDADLFDVKFFDASEGWAVGGGGTVLHTVDGGANWRIEMSGTTHPLESLCFIERTRGWAVGFGGTIISYAPVEKTPRRPSFKTAN